MKTLFLRVFVSLAILAGLSATTFADTYGVSWNEHNFVTEYDDSVEELTIDFGVYSGDGNPGVDLFLEMEIGNETCEMDLDYSSFYIKGECILDIDQEDIRGLYETSFIVYDEDEEEVYDDSYIEITVEGEEEEFDWDKLIVDATYDEEEEDLELKIYLEDISREPSYRYEIEFEIDEKEYTKRFTYDDDEEEISYSFTVGIDENDIDDEYEIGFKVYNYDLDDDRVGSGDLKFDVDIISKDDDFDWDDLEYTAEYDEDREELEIILILPNIDSEPKRDYKSYIEFEGEEYDERFSYDEDEEQLIAEYSIDIDEDDIENEYDFELIIEDDYDDEMFDDDFEIVVDGVSESSSDDDDLDWDDIEYSAIYDMDEEELTVRIYLSDVNSEPELDYESYIEFDGDDYDEGFNYDDDIQEFYVEYTFDIDEDDIEDEYEIELVIEDEDEDEVFDEDIEINVIDLDDADDFDWDELEITAEYDENDEVLYVDMVLEDISSTPVFKYTAEFEFGNEEESEEFVYNSSNDELRLSIEVDIDENDIENEYEFDIQIENEDGEEVFDDEIDIDVDEYEQEEDEDEERYISNSTRTAIDNFVDKTYKRYSDRTDALGYFGIVIIVFDNYADTNPKYRSAVDDINYLLQQEIDNN